MLVKESGSAGENEIVFFLSWVKGTAMMTASAVIVCGHAHTVNDIKHIISEVEHHVPRNLHMWAMSPKRSSGDHVRP